MGLRVDPLTYLRPIRGDELHALTAEHDETPSGPLAYDVYRAGGELVIEFDVPGVEPRNIEVALAGGALVVTVTRQLPISGGADLIEAGRQHGTFTQRLFLGNRWDVEHLRASTANGVLSVRAPVAADPARLHIPVTDESRRGPAWAGPVGDTERATPAAAATGDGRHAVEVVRHSAA